MRESDFSMQELIEEYRLNRRLLLARLREMDRSARERQRVLQRIRSMSWPKWLRLDLEQYADTKDRQYLEVFVLQAEAVWESLTPKQQAAVQEALDRLAMQGSFEDELLSLLSGEDEERPRMRVSFHKLSPQQREALKLALQGFSRKEIGEMLHVRKGTADVHVRRGRKKFEHGVQLALDLGWEDDDP